MNLYTEKDHLALLEEWREEGEEWKDESWYPAYEDREWSYFDIPTGRMYYLREEDDDILVSHAHFLEHGRRWTAEHDPTQLAYVGGSVPF